MVWDRGGRAGWCSGVQWQRRAGPLRRVRCLVSELTTAGPPCYCT